MSQDEAAGLDDRSAELLARQINTAFTMASGYGTSHPMFHRACGALLESLQAALEHRPTVSLLMDRGALFVDKFPVGQRFNPRRLMNLLSQRDIESISFSRGVSLDDINHLMVMSSDQTDYADVNALSNGLQSHGVTALQLNYIRFRQVTADQKVVGEHEPGGSSEPTPTSASENFEAIASLLSLDELVKDPGDYAEKLEQESSDDAKRGQVLRQLRHLVSQVERGEVETGTALSSDAVLGAVNDLRTRVRKNLDTKRDVERILSEEDQVMGEIDQLTYSTLVSLVRGEFRQGRITAARMAQIINRMLPDARDLKRLLPQLKQGLLAEGMSVEQWAELVHELSSELRGENLVQALEEGAESVGLDVDEIVEQIREDPAEAARLIVLATELRRTGAGEEEQLSAAFSDYIERISDKLSLELGNGAPDSGTLDSQLTRVRQLLVDQLGRQGLPPELIESLRAHLQPGAGAKSSPKAPETPGAAPHRDADASPTNSQAGAYSSLDQASLTDSLPSTESASDSRILSSMALPDRVLNPPNTSFFLSREIKGSQRYKTPFSVIKLTIELVRDRPGPPRAPQVDDLIELMPQVYKQIIPLLRDLDLVGSLDQRTQAVPLMILPMTPADGADIVLKRLLERMQHTPFRLAGMPTQLFCAVSTTSFQFEDGESEQAFIDRIEEEHEISREMLHLDHDTTDLKSESGLKG